MGAHGRPPDPEELPRAGSTCSAAPRCCALSFRSSHGSLLAFAYVPSASEAYESLLYLTYEQDLGWFMRAMHYWGSNFMVGIMLLHMTQVFLFGAYKYPREITWITGCVLMLCTLGMAFTGQVLRWDEDAYWGLGIGAAIMGRVPFIGEGLVNLMLGGPIIASETLSRFFSLHVFIIPGTILALLAVHLRMVLAKGINEYPKPGHLVRRETYDKEYETIIKKEGIPFAPHGIWKDVAAAAITIGGILFARRSLARKARPARLYPADIDTLPRPDFFFMWIFSVAALMPGTWRLSDSLSCRRSSFLFFSRYRSLTTPARRAGAAVQSRC